MVADLARHHPPVVDIAIEDVAHTKVPLLMSASDVMILTSDHEGSPVVTKEALC